MDNTKYYPELSDMAVLLSNMVTKKGWRGKNWHNKTENLGDTDIQSFMWHYGNEDIEIHDMSSYYDDANVCRYAIGQHDVVLRRGKVNNKVRNVITVAIGEIPEKTAELTANLYGLLGDNEEYSEYHHIGYDITAGRIFEKLLRYTENYNNNQKVFFITGARSAGGVANLLSKKLIDRFGPRRKIIKYTVVILIILFTLVIIFLLFFEEIKNVISNQTHRFNVLKLIILLIVNFMSILSLFKYKYLADRVYNLIYRILDNEKNIKINKIISKYDEIREKI